MNWMKSNQVLPQISATEWQALKAGTTWIDGEFFSGNPDFGRILSEPYRDLAPEERAFLDGPVEELLQLVDRYEISRNRQIPENVIAFIKQAGMMGLRIPKEFGGKQFSVLAVSTIISKISAYNAAVGTLVVIPNSLGAAELIGHYGTSTQRQHYLPKLARGEYIPCFALTELTAGSDAAAIKAHGEVFRQPDGTVSIRLNFRKRYITLAPIADLATLACKLHDPDNLLGKGEEPGITCVLVHKGTSGLIIGDHHEPIGDPFYNGPLEGRNVIVAADSIIGGPRNAGEGWRMLMEQLAGGRMVSLPASAAGSAKAVAAFTGPYSMVRQQFGMSIGLMDGVVDKIGRIAALSYMLEAARIFTCSAVDAGQAPPVVSAIMKAYCTEISRQLVIDGMDVFAGAGVMQGPNNILGRGYTSSAVGITVEGANILTRTLMIFPQGITRCHPYALKIVNATEGNDVAAFRASLISWAKHFLVGLARISTLYVTGGFLARAPVSGPLTAYYRRLKWGAARFAILSDIALFAIAGKLKTRGNLAGRYADILAWMILAASTLRRFEADGTKAEDLPLVHYVAQHALSEIQKAFEDIYANFGGPIGLYLRTVGALILRVNPLGRPPKDEISRQAASTIQSASDQYRRLTRDVFVPHTDHQGSGRLLKAFKLACEARTALEAVRSAQKSQRLPSGNPEQLGDEAVRCGVLCAEDGALLNKAYQAQLEAIEVDVFTPAQYFGVRPAAESPSTDDTSGKTAVNV